MDNDFDTALKVFIAGCQAKVDAGYNTNSHETGITRHVEIFGKGRRYVKLTTEDYQGEVKLNRRSAYAFVDKTTGDVLKPASWTAPAKHARGNIFDDSNGLSQMSEYGPAYLKY